jgi:hypothetical protein
VYWTGENAKQSAIDYAKGRAKFGRGEIRVLAPEGPVEKRHFFPGPGGKPFRPFSRPPCCAGFAPPRVGYGVDGSRSFCLLDAGAAATLSNQASLAARARNNLRSMLIMVRIVF